MDSVQYIHVCVSPDTVFVHCAMPFHVRAPLTASTVHGFHSACLLPVHFMFTASQCDTFLNVRAVLYCTFILYNNSTQYLCPVKLQCGPYQTYYTESKGS